MSDHTDASADILTLMGVVRLHTSVVYCRSPYPIRLSVTLLPQAYVYGGYLHSELIRHSVVFN